MLIYNSTANGTNHFRDKESLPIVLLLNDSYRGLSFGMISYLQIVLLFFFSPLHQNVQHLNEMDFGTQKDTFTSINNMTDGHWRATR